MQIEKRAVYIACSVVLLLLLYFVALSYRHSYLISSPTHRAFYYWKTEWRMYPNIVLFLRQNHISQLYVRFFDVDLDSKTQRPVPIAPIQVSSAFPEGVEVIPVVYIQNEVFYEKWKVSAFVLAEQVAVKLQKMATENGISIREVQIDCDWTDSTREKYFKFLRQLNSGPWRLSATLRLHQIKYKEQTGVPPVSKGMLMFYNVGKLSADPNTISIYNTKDANKYVAFIKKYPLPLDLGLPVFSWSLHTRGGKPYELIEEIKASEFRESTLFSMQAENVYLALSSFFFRGHYFQQGDQVKTEEITPSLTKEAARLAWHSLGLRQTFSTVALFDLNPNLIVSYEKGTFDEIFNVR